MVAWILATRVCKEAQPVGPFSHRLVYDKVVREFGWSTAEPRECVQAANRDT